MGNKVLSAALKYASLGWYVFPLLPNSKKPLTGFLWKEKCTVDPDTIRKYWDNEENYNVGIVCGKISNLLAVDLDTHQGSNGKASFAEITPEGYAGVEQITPSGGKHLLYEYVEGFSNFTRKGAYGGIDLRTDNGYIVGAPSYVVEKEKGYEGIYSIKRDGPIPTLPINLVECFATWSIDTRVSDCELPLIPDELPDFRNLNLSDRYVDYLENGNIEYWTDSNSTPDESAAIFAVAGALMRKVDDPGVVLGILADNDHALACAARHRDRGDPVDWLWKYGIAKMVGQIKAPQIGDMFDAEGYTFNDPEPIHSEKKTLEIAKNKIITWADRGLQSLNIKPNWLIKGVLERGQVGLLFGDSQSYKSYICLDMCSSLVLGLPWQGFQIPKPGKSLIIAGEGNVALWRRLEAWKQNHFADNSDLKNLGITCKGVNFLDSETLQDIVEDVKNSGSTPDLVIVDTMSRNMLGDENSAQEVSEFLVRCDAMSRGWNCTTVVVHHSGHMDKSRARGSSALEANSDFYFKVQRHHLEGIKLTSIEFLKTKNTLAPSPIVLEARTQFLGINDEDGNELSDLVMSKSETTLSELLEKDTNEKQQKLKANQKTLLKVFNDMRSDLPIGSDAGIAKSELWIVYKKFKLDTDNEKTVNRTNFNSDLAILVSDARLVIETDSNGQDWVKLGE